MAWRNRTALGLLAVVGLLPFGCRDDSCFAGDTLVATPAGPRRIDALAEGDEVLSFDHASRRLVVGRVRRTFRHEGALLGRLSGAGVDLRLTAQHPIFDATAGEYVAAGAWREQSEALLLGGAAVDPSRGLEFRSTRERATVFNLEVEGHHNYFAGGVLVHNKTPPCDETYRCFDVDLGGGGTDGSDDDVDIPDDESGGQAGEGGQGGHGGTA